MNPRRTCIELIDPLLADSFRRMTPAEKLSRAFDLWDFAMSVSAASIARDHPDWPPDQIQQEIVRRMGRAPPHE